ncbi:type II secretion system protein GspM [Alteromonas lipolytica]|uniref:Type II secretion system protein M n=1 Tax=Alteromonas lipolytica TaxID=1856405 RepID=A0A1E8FAY9_9ALTE|nr:type II secretion system protein M [Alteromonas lipolytica]OFI33094.1 general secretion pathway protein GspM [Alteromonas lipolytica]GGF62548.1 type II secretion system protein M [Alteromonas lipolytica]
MNALKQKFAALTEREQRLVILSALVVLVGLFYWGLWAPLNQSIAQQTQLLQSNKKLVTWVEEQGLKAAQLRRNSAAPARVSGSLPQLVTSTSSKHSLSISRMQPQGDEIQVWIDEAPFNSLVGWLDELENRGIVIDQLDVAEANDPGMIKVRRLVLTK